MSSRTAAARKRLQDPLPKSPARAFTSTTRTRAISNPPPLRVKNLTHITTIHESSAYPRRLDLSNEFPQTLASPEYTYFSPPPPPEPSYTKPKKIVSSQPIQVVSPYTPTSPYDNNIRKSRQPQLRLDTRQDVTYQPLPPLPNPKLQSPKRPSPKRPSPAKVLVSYAEQAPQAELPCPPSYPPPSPTRYWPGHPVAVPYSPPPSSSPPFRSGRHSPTPTDLPDYSSTYSHYPYGRQSFQTSTRSLVPPRGDYQSHRYQHPYPYPYPYPYPSQSTSGLSPPMSATLSPIHSESRLPYRNYPGVRTSYNTIPSPIGTSREALGDSAAVSILSGNSGTYSTSTGDSRPPPPPPSPNFVFPGSRSVARPKVSSKITNSQLRSKSRLRPGKVPQANSRITLDVPSPNGQMGFATAPSSPVYQSNYPETLLDTESIAVLSDDYERMSIRKAPGADAFVFPSSRSRAQPKASSRPSKNSNYSSRGRDTDQPRGRTRIMELLFKKKKKVKTPNLSPGPSYMVSDSETSSSEHVHLREEQIPSSSRFTGRREMRRVKTRSGSYPLDPYNSVLLDNDRLTGELLSRLNPTGSPSFHDYRHAPPSSVLDLGCGQGHWVLEAAVAWKEYGTMVTGYDMVDISRNMLPWAAENGVRENIRFVRGNFLKQQLPFGNGSFDLVRMSCLALCITSDSWGFVLQEVRRVLMTGGRLELIDDQMFFPYGKVSSLMNDTNSIAETVESFPPRLSIVLSPTVTTFSIYGDFVANPGLGSTLEQRGSDRRYREEDEFDLEDETATIHRHKSRRAAPEITPVQQQPRSNVTLPISPEAWNRALIISEDLEALFEHMLLDKFDIQKDPSEFILSLMQRVFGEAQEVKTMNLVLAPPDSTASSEYTPPPHDLSQCPGLVLLPSTLIPMDRTEVELHASKHLRTLLSCKNILSQHSIEIAEDERVDEEFVSEALWEYESFLRHRFNPPASLGDDSDHESTRSIAESTNSDSREAMLEIQSQFRHRFTWLAETDPRNNTLDGQMNTPVTPKNPTFPSPTVSSPRSLIPPPPPPPPPVASSNESTHIRTFRVYEAIKLDNYTLTYDIP